MLLAIILAAQTAPAQDERACIIETLPAAQQVNLAERFIHGEMDTMLAIAGPSADACQGKWKWDAAAREWQIVHSAALLAMMRLEGSLPGFPAERLEGLFMKLSAADRYGFTFEGSSKLDQAANAALFQRAAAVLAAEKLAGADLEAAGQWFIAYARFAESVAHLDALKPG